MRIPKLNFADLTPELRAQITLNNRKFEKMDAVDRLSKNEQNKRKFEVDQAAFEAGKTKQRKKPSHAEDDFQKALKKWLDTQANSLKFIWYAIPNGGLRDAKTGARLKATGVKAGVPDLFISRACNGFHGCYVELKTATGRLSYHQKIMINNLRFDGYCVLIVRSIDEAVAEIEKYLSKS